MTDLPVNQKRDDETLKQFHERIISGYPAGKIEAAVEFLRRLWKAQPELVNQIRAAIAVDPQAWCAGYHFGWGMVVRNELREAGYGEEYWPIWNMDDLYVPLVERAVADVDDTTRKEVSNVMEERDERTGGEGQESGTPATPTDTAPDATGDSQPAGEPASEAPAQEAKTDE